MARRITEGQTMLVIAPYVAPAPVCAPWPDEGEALRTALDYLEQLVVAARRWEVAAESCDEHCGACVTLVELQPGETPGPAIECRGHLCALEVGVDDGCPHWLIDEVTAFLRAHQRWPR